MQQAGVECWIVFVLIWTEMEAGWVGVAPASASTVAYDMAQFAIQIHAQYNLISPYLKNYLYQTKAKYQMGINNNEQSWLEGKTMWATMQRGIE